MKSQRAFTLIEVLVVVMILGVLAALVVPCIMDRPDEARKVAAQADVRAIVQALKLYRLDNGFYPSTEQGLGALSCAGVSFGVSSRGSRSECMAVCPLAARTTHEGVLGHGQAAIWRN